MQKMCFAQAYPAINKKGIIRSAGSVCHSLAGGMNELIAGADNKISKGILRVYVFGYELPAFLLFLPEGLFGEPAGGCSSSL